MIMSDFPSSSEVAPGAKLFNAHYFATGCGEIPYSRTGLWAEHFQHIAEQILADIQPATVLDAGCAMGVLVERLRMRGVEAEGVDISEYAISQAAPHVRPYLRIQSLTQPLQKHYDLIVCIEVLEHLEKREAEQALANLCGATDDILFSSSPLDYSEPTHFNVQPPEYWATLFARHGFYRDFDYDADNIAVWAARFRRVKMPLHQLVHKYERRLWHVHQQNGELRRKVVEQQLKLSDNQSNQEQLRTAIQDREIQAEAHRRQIHSILTSPGWRLIQGIHRLRKWLAPTDSRREKWLLRVTGKWLSNAG